MVLRTMLSSAANGSSGPGLARQPSMYSLTLEELQNAINEPGKSIGSMNMEEFIRNLWTAEESQAMATAMADNNNNSLARQTSLQRLNSVSLPPALSRKTVEDVWKDIQQQPVADPIDRQHHQRQQQHHFQQQRQSTLGEMTLEDFLVRAGLVREDPEAISHMTDGSNAMSLYSGVQSGSVPPAMDGLTSPSLSSDWMTFTSPHQHQHMLQQAEAAAVKRGLLSPPLAISSGNLLYDGLSDGTAAQPDSLASSLALSPAVSEYAVHGRKRSTSEAVIEKTMERRQKRMIKNRESAARSRARKQAYTVELEAEVTKLKEENARLKQQQDMESRLPESMRPQHLKIRVLRRVQSL